MRGDVRIGRPIFERPDCIRFKLTVTGRLRRFIRDDFWCEYDFPVDTLPTQILYVPLLASLLPVIWVGDGRLCLDVVDEDFHQATSKVRAALQAIYPGIEFGGHVEVGNVVTTDAAAQPRRSISLYSGGVDSTASALAHRADDLTLATVWGIDLEPRHKDAWQAVRRRAERFAAAHGMKNAFIKSNLRWFISEPRLNDLFRDHLGHWWRAIAGFALLGMTAPLSHAVQASTVYIPSSFSEGTDFAWGGVDPSVDNQVRWSGVECIHDLYIPRPRKVKLIVEQSASAEVLVCPSGTGFDGENCGKCEKCCRTIVQFLLAGSDPRRHGLPMTQQTLSDIRDSIEKGRFRFASYRVFFWQGIQRAIATSSPSAEPGADEFFSWLQQFDFDEAKRRSSQKNQAFRKAVRWAGRLVPQRSRRTARKLYFSLFREI